MTLLEIRLAQAELKLTYLRDRCRRTAGLVRQQAASQEEYEEDYFNCQYQELEVEALKLEVSTPLA